MIIFIFMTLIIYMSSFIFYFVTHIEFVRRMHVITKINQNNCNYILNSIIVIIGNLNHNWDKLPYLSQGPVHSSTRALTSVPVRCLSYLMMLLVTVQKPVYLIAFTAVGALATVTMVKTSECRVWVQVIYSRKHS